MVISPVGVRDAINGPCGRKSSHLYVPETSLPATLSDRPTHIYGHLNPPEAAKPATVGRLGTAVQSPGAADKRGREPPKAARAVRAAYRWIEPVDRPEFSSNTSRQRQRLERQIDGTCTESAVVMFAARQGEAARPPDVSGRNGAPVETQIERLDRNGDSFSSKFNDRNVSPAGLRGHSR